MKKIVIFVFAIISVGFFVVSTDSCTGKRAESDSVMTDSVLTADTLRADTLETVIEETPMPKAADELFDDFFFNFAANRRLQMRRIVFPLPEYKDGRCVAHLQKKQWKNDVFFMSQDFYTLLFDSEKQMNLVKDTSVANVVVEKIMLQDEMVKQYVFKRMGGQWRLTALKYNDVNDNVNSSFWRFYSKFVADSAFQASSIAEPLAFVGPSPDDDFGTISGTISPEQWVSFTPELPTDMVFNINYGQKYSENKKKIFVIRGIANGLETQLTFVCRNGVWKLSKLTT